MNTAELLEKQAESLPNKPAIVFKNKTISFKELDETINRFAHYFIKRKIKPGDKVLVFIRPSIELPATTFALFKVGAIPIFIDPGVGINNLLRAVGEASPTALIAPPFVYGVSVALRSAFKSVRVNLYASKLQKQSRDQSSQFKKHEATEDEMAAILFTSGATGRPKGVVYTHKIFIAQTRLLQELYSLTSDDVDCPYFSLFSFFTLAMGMTAFIPSIDPSRPARVNPHAVVTSIRESKATFTAGSPTIWAKVADYCLAHDIQLPSLRSLVMFGAPVEVSMHEKWQRILPNGTTYTPYGATESLPVSNISGVSILDNTAGLTLAGAGVCVGKPVPSVEVMIAEDNEILVCGDTTTKEYYNEPDVTQERKLVLDGRLWHRSRDVGSIDEEGRIWFWGRKAYVVDLGAERMYPVPCETVFNQHPRIKRTALVGPRIGSRIVPSLVIELEDSSTVMTEALLKELLEIRDAHEHTKPIEKFFLKKSFPVDVRHNIKIDNLALCAWVEEKGS